MKDIQTYINSGIVEDYVLGLATASEAAELERYMLEHPELAAEVDLQQQALETFSADYAIAAPVSSKDAIWSKIVGETTTNIKPFSPKQVTTVTKKSDFPTYAKAASLALILGLGLLNFFFFAKWNNSKKQAATEIAEAKNELENSQKQRDTMANALAIMAAPSTKMVILEGMPNYKDCSAKVFWDKDKHTVYLLPSKMPAAPAGHQYQLWGMVDGKPVDAGMITNGSKPADLQTMKAFDNAQAFAITLEVEGGNATPTMENLVVMGKI